MFLTWKIFSVFKNETHVKFLINYFPSNKTISPHSFVDKGQPYTAQISLLTHQL